MHTHHSIFQCTHHSIYNLHTCIHTTPICMHTHMHTHSYACMHTHMHTHPTHTHNSHTYAYTQPPYAYTPTCIHIIPYAHTSLLNLQSHQQLYVVPCVLQHVGNYCYSVTPFSLFLYFGLNKENVCLVCARACSLTCKCPLAK